jgi:hypothetical protein
MERWQIGGGRMIRIYMIAILLIAGPGMILSEGWVSLVFFFGGIWCWLGWSVTVGICTQAERKSGNWPKYGDWWVILWCIILWPYTLKVWHDEL